MYTWNSQPVERAQPLGNLLISGAILTTGGTFNKMHEFASALNLQNNFLKNTEAIIFCQNFIKEKWGQERKKALEEVKSLGSVVLAGDDWCDSPVTPQNTDHTH